MICVKSEYWGSKDGKEVVKVAIIADSTPDTFPTDGSTVDNMDDNKLIAPQSYIQIVGNGGDNGYVYFYNGEGWHKWE